MTLKEYYDGLPEKTAPKSDFIRKVTRACGVTPCTVRNWIKGSFTPDDPDNRSLISRLTHIPESELFPKCK